jgi:hypothetical protein
MIGRMPSLPGAVGYDEDLINLTVMQVGKSNGAYHYAGVGVDSVSVNSCALSMGIYTTNNLYIELIAQYIGTPGIGFHYFQWLEYVTGAHTMAGDDGSTLIQTGIMGTILA